VSRYEDALAGLKTFQRDTVEYVTKRMFDEGQRRFLVADEVGLGKTHVARGIVANAIERLEDDGVKRIDIVYICSNQEIAAQNIRKLNPLIGETFNRAQRITLLPLYLHDLKPRRARTKHNFISFTPGTMPDKGTRTGQARERALIYLMLAEAWGFGRRKGPKRVLQATTRTAHAFEGTIDALRTERIDPGLQRRFVQQLRRVERKQHTRARFDELATLFARRQPRGDENDMRNRLISDLRWELAQTCINALEPDLIILDEFQRFRDLLDSDSDAAELAQAMFNYPAARVLLLSATPYRMYSQAGEPDEEDHHRDFTRTVRFLFDTDTKKADEVEQLLERFRLEILRADRTRPAIVELRFEIEQRLQLVIARTERLAASDARLGMLNASAGKEAHLKAGDLAGFIAIQGASRDLGERRTATLLEYWKSTPYMLNLMDGYRIKGVLRDAARTRKGAATLRRHLRNGDGLLPFEALLAYKPLDAANARMRTLAEDTIDASLWQLLWLPPTLPYYSSRPPFDRPGSTKRLVFSSWNVVPKAIAALLSYEAERKMIRATERNPANTPEDRAKLDRRLLDFKRATKSERPTGMPVLGLLYPSFALAELADPLELRRSNPDETPTHIEAVGWAASRIEGQLARLESDENGSVDERWYWAAPILLDLQRDRKSATEWLDRYWLPEIWSEGYGDLDTDTRDSAWREHVELAAELTDGETSLRKKPDDLATVMAELAIAGPGVTVLRALARQAGGTASLRDSDIRDAAAAGAWPFRTLLNHPEAITLVRSVVRSKAYWRRALRYCVLGGLQAVLDEYTHLLHDLRGLNRLGQPAAAWEVAKQLRVSAGLKTAAVVADEVSLDSGSQSIRFDPFTMRSRFAAHYGATRELSGETRTRAESLRDSFNSPFWPFVLASTSVGQEGLDFHAYCHAVIHWNLPTNPVDLEQREGRVHRYKGHAVRKNLAAALANEAFQTTNDDPWDALFEAAARPRTSDERDIVPYWVYPGKAKIERHVPMLPLSKDADRYRRLQRSLALYRMVLGQPRQEDLVELLAGRGQVTTELAYEMRIDLTPPRR
jgi:hypothetical protein